MNTVISFGKAILEALSVINYPQDKKEFASDIIKVVCANSVLDLLETMPEKSFDTLFATVKKEKTEKLAEVLPQYFITPEYESIFTTNFVKSLQDFIQTISEKALPEQKIKLQLILEDFASSVQRIN